jgi:hypothetical protein
MIKLNELIQRKKKMKLIARVTLKRLHKEILIFCDKNKFYPNQKTAEKVFYEK